MRKTMSMIAAAFCLAQVSMASTIAVIDSGVDTKHVDLQGHIWVNQAEIAGNGIDDDGDGFVDDINGWNFVKNSNQLIDYRFGWFVQEDVRRFMDIENKYIKGMASQDEIAWAKEKQKSRWFILKLMTFGNYVHGTHVSGITVKGNEKAKVLGIKLIPTLGILGSVHNNVVKALDEGQDPSVIAQIILKAGLSYFAKSQAQMFTMLGDYANAHQADVVNGSFGTAMAQAKLIVTPLLKLVLKGQEPSEALVKEYAEFLMNQMVKENQAMLNAAPNSLFVFAAGNDGSNNDVNPVVPANIRGDNKIAVAATVGNSSLASFSNFGDVVDVAAPGVAIESSIPGNEHAALSGTSQASPYVAQVAAAVKDANTALKPVEMKQIIMGTVDHKDFLVGKVKSQGIVNKVRAVRAATLAAQMPLAQAINQAKSEIADAPQEMTTSGVHDHLFVMPLPSFIR